MAKARDLIFEDHSVDPGTHALVIGVGKYPHLLGGGERTSPDAEGMRQLSSPPISARAFADWLRNEYRFPDKPLASLALLLSEQVPGPDAKLANSSNVVQAVREWKARATSNPNNRLIFYFCGHGISQGEDMALLLSDFGASVDNPLDGALDFRQLVSGLKPCAASQQLFFVDACRASTDTMIAGSGGSAGVVPLLPRGRPKPPELPPMVPITYFATLAGSDSHARPNQASLFTDALIKGLRGAGSDNTDDGSGWCVTTTRLQDALNHFLGEPTFAGQMAKVQIPVATELITYDLHSLSGQPTVPVYVRCPTPDETKRAQYVCLLKLNLEEKARREPDGKDGEKVFELPADEYLFMATLAAEDIRTKTLTIRPVSRRLVMGAES
ncbi:caspase family protein [Mycobacterium sp. 1465703.0]|uniref:caspase family protein n=1 Tax=Mycobacterium sp. 1465703.0 TaxID=1834078 RepID=UPI0007FBAC46|nr:caspase family protein [Mycobacterium sp. 1465703.0]OBJ08570.1 hypothetical protein A5625_14575 [Mycobacterium sp. 1465703.0]